MNNTDNTPRKVGISTNELVQVKELFIDVFKDMERRKVGRPSNLTTADVAVILLIQNEYGNQNLKKLYKELLHHFSYLFALPSYKNFVLTMHRETVELLKLLLWLCNYYSTSNPKFLDSTPLPVCKIWREKKHKTMKVLARKSKSTTGWYYGLKLHLVCNEDGNLVCIRLTTANVDDRVVLERIISNTQYSNSMIVADAGYVGKGYQKQAVKNNSFVITPCRSNMRVLSTLWENELMNMRSIIESVFSSLKTHYNLTSTLSRSINGYLSNYFRSLFRYSFRNIFSYVRVS